jgi:serine protease Do
MLAAAITAAEARPMPGSFADLAAELTPAVVNISTTQNVEGSNSFDFQFPPGSPFEEFFKEFLEKNRPSPNNGGPRGPRRQVTSLGSGFVIDAGGLIVTNNHVIADADEISVRFRDGTKLSAEVVGKDSKTDIAVLRVKSDKPLPSLRWGDSDASRVGDWVLAIGNPFGLGGSVTAGIISARGRDINSGPYDDFIQTDASINRGNSGGPLFNIDGEVIGVNTAIFSPSGGSVGIGFAIPASLAKDVVNQLAKYGRTRRGWLGVRIQSVTDEIAEGMGLGAARGALVAGVTDDGPAAAAGIQAGDVILKFDGADVPEMRLLPRMVAGAAIGEDVPVEIWRNGTVRTVQVKLGELEEAEARMAATDPSRPGQAQTRTVDTLGMTVSDITAELREQYELEEAEDGVVVTEVGADSAAAEKGVQPGDVIVEVANEKVASARDLETAIERIRKEKQRNVVILRIKQKGVPRFVPLALDPK